MNPGLYRRRLDALLQEFVKDAYRTILPWFQSSKSDAEILAGLTGPLHRVISRHRVEVWALADEFVNSQAALQGYRGNVTTPRLRRYSEQAVRTLLERRLELRARDDDESGLGRDARQTSFLTQAAARHFEAAGRSAIEDLAKELETERRQMRRATPSPPRSSADDDADDRGPAIGTAAARARQDAVNARGVEDFRIESTDDADVFEAPMWARVLTGADNCEFCVMLASRPGTARGDFYTSQWAALFTDLGNKYHDHCDCIAVPIFNPRTWAGRAQAEQLYDLWKTATTTTSSRPYDKDIPWDERVPALAEFRDYMNREAAEGRDPLRDIVGDLREAPEAQDELTPTDTSSDVDWRARQDAIGLDFGDDELEPHEIEFLETFLALGNDVAWIPRDRTYNRPTNDFRWNDLGIDAELKSTKNRYPTIRNAIRSAVASASKHGVVKENFIIDLGRRALDDRLRLQLEQYNQRNPKHRISRLFVVAAGVLVEIALAAVTR